MPMFQSPSQRGVRLRPTTSVLSGCILPPKPARFQRFSSKMLPDTAITFPAQIGYKPPDGHDLRKTPTSALRCPPARSLETRRRAGKARGTRPAHRTRPCERSRIRFSSQIARVREQRRYLRKRASIRFANLSALTRRHRSVGTRNLHTCPGHQAGRGSARHRSFVVFVAGLRSPSHTLRV